MKTLSLNITAQKMKFSIKDFFSKCEQIRSFLPIRSHLQKKWKKASVILLIKTCCLKDTHKKKAPSKKNSNAFETYEYGYLGVWYIKSTLNTRFLNINKVFEKIK